MDLKNFLKAPSAPKYTNFEWGAHAKKNAIFWSKFSKKSLKTLLGFFGLFFFQSFACGAEILAKMLWENSQNQFVRPEKKGRQKFRKIFENPHHPPAPPPPPHPPPPEHPPPTHPTPPSRKPRSAPDYKCKLSITQSLAHKNLKNTIFD